MYEPINEEFVEDVVSNQQEVQLSLNKDEERDIFVDNLLTNFLGPEKQKDKGLLASRLKFKRHQIEGSLKSVKKEDEKKKPKAKSKHKKKIFINSKLKKSLKMYKLDKTEILDYTKYEKMNEVWTTYASSCLLTCLPKNPDLALNEESTLNCLKQIDYHGCIITVTRSQTKSLIGLSGIILQDRRNVLFVLGRDNKIKIIPKFGSLFQFEILGCKFTLVGSNMCYRPEMRTTKHAKIKTKKNII